MNQSGESIKVVHPLFQEEGGGSIPTSPLQLNIGPVAPDVAIALNAAWHSRLPNCGNVKMCGHLACYAAEYDGVYYASAIWTDPIARALNGFGWLELRRLAIGPLAPKNTASRVLKVMRLMVGRRFPEICKLISYQDTSVHTGAIYGAAGWSPVETRVNSGNWQSSVRHRDTPTPEKDRPKKIRWEFDIRSAPPCCATSPSASPTKTADLFVQAA
jgi:hypothetical protein